MKSRRGGFTVIELVTVMAIIAILIALLVVGVSHIVTSNKIKQTHIMLQNCRNLLAEMEVNNGLNQQPPEMYIRPLGNPVQPTGTPPTVPYDLWHYYDYTQVNNGQAVGPHYRALYANARITLALASGAALPIAMTPTPC